MPPREIDGDANNDGFVVGTRDSISGQAETEREKCEKTQSRKAGKGKCYVRCLKSDRWRGG